MRTLCGWSQTCVALTRVLLDVEVVGARGVRVAVVDQVTSGLFNGHTLLAIAHKACVQPNKKLIQFPFTLLYLHCNDIHISGR